MNKHLRLVRAYHDACSWAQAEFGASAQLSDMDRVLRQALLMESGAEALKAIKAGEMADILVGLVDVAYCALGAIAKAGSDVIDRPVSWQHDGFVLSVMRLLSEKIDRCASGNTDDYSEAYCVCAHLASSFLNADFDKAFQKLHDSYMSELSENGRTIYDDAETIRKAKPIKAPDLSDCLYE